MLHTLPLPHLPQLLLLVFRQPLPGCPSGPAPSWKVTTQQTMFLNFTQMNRQSWWHNNGGVGFSANLQDLLELLLEFCDLVKSLLLYTSRLAPPVSRGSAPTLCLYLGREGLQFSWDVTHH